jgi:hypothetical protein
VVEPTKNAEIHPALAEALRADRESLNQRFAMRQRVGARIDEMAFQEHLRTTVNDLVHSVAKAQPERVRAVVNSLFDVSLDLFAAGLLGAKTKHPHVNTAWRELLPRAARLLAREPTRIAGAVSNAVDHLAAHTSARPVEWIDGMGKLAPHCDSVTMLLDAGKVLAWRAGLVQYRTGALVIARALPWKLAARCFDVLNEVAESDWTRQLEQLESDRWYSPAIGATQGGSRSPRIVRTTGGFRGFGGPCTRLPTVTANDAGIFVADGDNAWQLFADTFGTLWHRVPSTLANGSASKPPRVKIDARGNVTWDGTHAFAELAEASSFASDGQTLAVTLPTSYQVFLLAQVK